MLRSLVLSTLLLALSAPVLTVSTCDVAISALKLLSNKCAVQTLQPVRQVTGFFGGHPVQVAGAVGIEPTTFGFGDRRSAN